MKCPGKGKHVVLCQAYAEFNLASSPSELCVNPCWHVCQNSER